MTGLKLWISKMKFHGVFLKTDGGMTSCMLYI